MHNVLKRDQFRSVCDDRSRPNALWYVCVCVLLHPKLGPAISGRRVTPDRKLFPTSRLSARRVFLSLSALSSRCLEFRSSISGHSCTDGPVGLGSLRNAPGRIEFEHYPVAELLRLLLQSGMLGTSRCGNTPALPSGCLLMSIRRADSFLPSHRPLPQKPPYRRCSRRLEH